MTNFFNGIATIDDQLCLHKADDAFYKFMDMDIYAPISDAIHENDLHRFREALNELKEKDMSKNLVTVRFRRRDGKYRWLLVEMAFEPFDINGIVMTNLKITDLAAYENRNAELKRQNSESDIWLGLTNIIMIRYDISAEQLEIFTVGYGRRDYLYQGTLASWRDSMKEKVEPMHAEQFANLCADMEAGKKNFEYEILINGFMRTSGRDMCRFRCQTVREMGRSYQVLGCVDVGGNSREKDILFGNSDSKDPGLDILNKRAITDYAKRIIKIGGGKKVYFVILDVDNFKTINDTYGHLFGDEVLAVVTDIIKQAVGSRGVIGRIGGDEIFIVVDRIEEHTELKNLLRMIRTNIEWAYKGKRDDMNLTCSMGAASYPDNGSSYDEVFELADKMLYQAKERGKNRYVIYIPELQDERLIQQRSEHKEGWMTELKKDKVGIMQRLIENYMVRKIVTNKSAFSEIGYGFGLDEILMLYEGESAVFQWTEEGVATDINMVQCVHLDDTFLSKFNKDNMFIMNGLYNLEGKSFQVKTALEEKGIQSAVFYQMKKDKKFFGYIMFAKKESRRKWSDYDIMVMAMIGKIFETALVGR